MLRRPPRAVLAWCGAGVAALVAVHTVAGDLAALHRRAREAGRAVPVLVAAHDLPLGATVGRGDLAVRTRYARHLPPRTLARPGEAVGRVVAVPVLAGSPVTDRHLAPRRRTGLDGVVPPGMRAVRVPVEEGLRPPPGSVVDVLVTFDPSVEGAGPDPTVTAVEGALVLAGDDGPDGGAVILLTDRLGAKRLATAVASGFVTLALAPPEEAAPG